MKLGYVATLQVFIAADSEAEACDVVSELLRPVVLDWSYLKVGGQLLTPTEKGYNEEDYEEGDFLR